MESVFTDSNFNNQVIMQNLFCIVFLTMTFFNLSGQATYSQLIDTEIGSTNSLKDLIVFNDKIYASVEHFREDTFFIGIIEIQPESQSYKVATVIENHRIGNGTTMTVRGDELYISCHDKQNDFSGIKILKLNKDLELLDVIIHDMNDDNRYYNDGILFHDDNFYLWGEGRDLIKDIPLGHIIKLDSTLTKIEDKWLYNFGTDETRIYNLQLFRDNNLGFYMKSDQLTGVKDTLHIVTIDTSGTIIKNLAYEDLTRHSRRMFLTLSDGDYVLQGNYRGPIGELYRVDHKTGDYMWQYVFPRDSVIWSRPYNVSDIIEADNGDIIASGFVNDLLYPDTEVLGTAGFILRLSAEGELRYLKRFQIPNEKNEAASGRYDYSSLDKMIEDDDGNLLLIGESVSVKTPPYDRYIWVLALDENGCYQDNCSDTVIVNKHFGDDIEFNIGDTWTYERVNELFNRLFFEEISISDTLTIDDRSCYVMDRGLISRSDTLCVEDRKIYFYDSNLDDYQLQYDFGSESYTSAYYNTLTNEIDSFSVFRDSVKTVLTSNGKFVDKFYFRSTWGYNSEYTIEAYENIGSNYSHPHLATGGLQIDDFFEFNSILRCFQSDTSLFKFVDYPCDSTYMSVSVEDEIEGSNVLYPNPTTDIVYIEKAPLGLQYKVTDSQGRLILQGKYCHKGIMLTEQGVYFIALYTDALSWTEKVIKY